MLRNSHTAAPTANSIASTLPITRRIPTAQVTSRISAFGMLATTDLPNRLLFTDRTEQALASAQRQLEELLQRQPANRRARVLLIRYWKEAGQLQNVQVLLAQLEQQNPDDPALQQGL